jgi:hypothetical protein
MIPELVVIGIVAVLVAAYGLVYRRVPSRFWNPLRTGMTLTTLCLVYSGAAIFGYTVPTYHLTSLHDIHSVGHVVWRQAEFGGVLGLLSIPMWWLGLRQLNRT